MDGLTGDTPKSRLTRTSNSQHKLVMILGMLVAAAAVAAALMIGPYLWQSKNQPLLSPAIAHAAEGYTAYFYEGVIPAGYALDTPNISVQKGVLFLPLTKSGKPGVSLTQQPLPDKFAFEDLQHYSTKVEGAAAPAVINDVEGRLVGIMPVSATKTLILLTAEPGMNKDELAELIRGLKAQR